MLRRILITFGFFFTFFLLVHHAHPNSVMHDQHIYHLLWIILLCQKPLQVLINGICPSYWFSPIDLKTLFRQLNYVDQPLTSNFTIIYENAFHGFCAVFSLYQLEALKNCTSRIHIFYAWQKNQIDRPLPIPFSW